MSLATKDEIFSAMVVYGFLGEVGLVRVAQKRGGARSRPARAWPTWRSSREAVPARWRPFVVELKAGGTAAEVVAQFREREYAALFAEGLLGECGAVLPLAVGIACGTRRQSSRLPR